MHRRCVGGDRLDHVDHARGDRVLRSKGRFELRELGGVGKFPVPQQVGRFLERGVPGQGIDVDPHVLQYPSLAIDVGHLRLGSDGVDKTLVELLLGGGAHGPKAPISPTLSSRGDSCRSRSQLGCPARSLRLRSNVGFGPQTSHPPAYRTIRAQQCRGNLLPAQCRKNLDSRHAHSPGNRPTPPRRPTTTIILVVLNLLVFIGVAVAVRAGSTTHEEVIRWGAVSRLDFHPWSLVTSVFLHDPTGLGHVGFNMHWLALSRNGTPREDLLRSEGPIY